MELINKVVVITGGASGIGRATAFAMAKLGASVAVVDINETGAAAVAHEIGAGAIAIGCNVADEEAVNAMVAKTERTLGYIDVLFNNAGVDTGGDPLSTPVEVWQSQWDINVMAHIYGIRAVLPGMLERGSGYILHTASMAGILTTHNNLTYAAIKHAVVGVAEWMSVTYHDRGIHTSLLAPMGVRTAMFDTASDFAKETSGPIKEPEDVAEQVIDAIREERFLILTDPLAKVWMDRKNEDLELWLSQMRRLQRKLDER